METYGNIWRYGDIYGNIWTKFFFALFCGKCCLHCPVGPSVWHPGLVWKWGMMDCQHVPKFLGYPISGQTRIVGWYQLVSYYTDITKTSDCSYPPSFWKKSLKSFLTKVKSPCFDEFWMVFFWCLTPHVAPLVAKSRSSFLARWLAPQWGGAQLLKQHAAFPVVSPEQLQSLASRGISVEIPWRKRAFQWEIMGIYWE